MSEQKKNSTGQACSAQVALPKQWHDRVTGDFDNHDAMQAMKAEINDLRALVASLAAPAQQLHVIPPPRGTGSQHEAVGSVLPESRVKELLSETRTHNPFDVDEWPIRFARAIESELASRGRAPTTQAEGK